MIGNRIKGNRWKGGREGRRERGRLTRGPAWTKNDSVHRILCIWS